LAININADLGGVGGSNCIFVLFGKSWNVEMKCRACSRLCVLPLLLVGGGFMIDFFLFHLHFLHSSISILAFFWHITSFAGLLYIIKVPFKRQDNDIRMLFDK